MNDKILEMFSKSYYIVHEGEYKYTKVATEPQSKSHFMVTKDDDEITVLTKKENLSELEIIETNEHSWILISLNLKTPFMAGTMATINSACFEAGLNNLIVSTYSKDYIIVRKDQLLQITSVLDSLGFQKNL